MRPEIPKQLVQDLLQLIQSEPNGMPEHQLLKQLTELGYQGFAPSLDPLELFQAHFLLFHLLYRLAPDWREQGLGELQIDCLAIQFKPLKLIGDHALSKADPLQSYYLDYRHFCETQTEDVVQMLDNFWNQFGRTEALPKHELEQAMRHLDIESTQPLSLALVNIQYRKLSRIHHPDKGGDNQTFQQISQAAETLRKFVKSHNSAQMHRLSK